MTKYWLSYALPLLQILMFRYFCRSHTEAFNLFQCSVEGRMCTTQLVSNGQRLHLLSAQLWARDRCGRFMDIKPLCQFHIYLLNVCLERQFPMSRRSRIRNRQTLCLILCTSRTGMAIPTTKRTEANVTEMGCMLVSILKSECEIGSKNERSHAVPFPFQWVLTAVKTARAARSQLQVTVQTRHPSCCSPQLLEGGTWVILIS